MDKSEKEQRFRAIRNKIRKYDPEITLQNCANILFKLERTSPAEWKGYTPWSILVIAKLSILDYKMCTRGWRNGIPKNNFNQIVNEIKDLDSDTSILFNDHPQRVYKFMRETAFQQFWFRNDLGRVDIARQVILFQKSGIKYPIDQKFIEILGLKYDEYLKISFLIYAALEMTSQNEFSIDFFRPTFDKIKRKTFELYLSHFGPSVEELSIRLKANQKIRGAGLQLKEQSPLIHTSFINRNGKFLCISSNLHKTSIRRLTYDLLKKNDPEKFSEAFGSVFEKYLSRGIDEAGIKYWDGSQIKQKQRITRKSVDYMLFDENELILVEVKATEISPLAKVNPTDEILSNALRSNITKAVKQIFTVAHDVSEGVYDGVNLNSISAFIVTYRTMYLGHFKDVWAEILSDDILPFLAKEKIAYDIIPLTNIYFLSVNEWDQLMSAVKAGMSLTDLIKKAAKDDLKPETSKFLFGMHIAQSNDDIGLDFLETTFNNTFEKIEQTLIKN